MFKLIEEAALRLQGVAHRTPVMTSRTLDAIAGHRVFLKCENFQRAGAFKFRGAYNVISQLDEPARERGVLAYSSGNHAQAVALVGKLLGVRATLVMPMDAPAAKLAATRDYGAEVITYDPHETTREKLAAQLAGERGFTLIPPFDHPGIVAGQGTAAKELIEDIGPLDLLLTPCGGGGLLSGSAISAKHLSPDCRVIGVEPEVADDATRSFKTGSLHAVDNPPTIADGLRTSSLGKLTFELIRKYVDDMITVSEGEIVLAMKFLWERMKIVVEPSAVLGVAAFMQRKVEGKNLRAGIILSGGNVDFSAALRWFQS